MRVYSHKDFKYDGLTLKLDNKEILKIIPVGLLYKILWPDGIMSEDSYNLTRAKENGIKHSIFKMNRP